MERMAPTSPVLLAAYNTTFQFAPVFGRFLSMPKETAAGSLGALIGKMRRWSSICWRLEARFKGVVFEGKCEFLGRPLISLAKQSVLLIGDGARVYSSKRANALVLFR